MGLLAAAFGVPYAASELTREDGRRPSGGAWLNPTASTPGIPHVHDEELHAWLNHPHVAHPNGSKNGVSAGGPSAGLGGGANSNASERQRQLQARRLDVEDTPVHHDLAEVLGSAISPNWVLERWPRVTSRLSTVDLQGYRVPFVSGTQRDDIAGALTYYFDTRQQLRRITFKGQTADTAKLLAVLQSMHGFRYQPTTQPLLQLYQSLGSGKPKGQLWIRPAEVVRDRRYPQSFDLLLILERG